MPPKPYPPPPIDLYRAAIFEAEEEAERRSQKGEDQSHGAAEIAVAERVAYNVYAEFCLREARRLVSFSLIALSALLAPS